MEVGLDQINIPTMIQFVLEQINIPNNIQFHRNTSEIKYSNILHSSLKISKLQSIIEKLEGQLR